MNIHKMPVRSVGLFHKEALMRNIASVATGLEVLESILVQKGILESGQLMKEIQEFLNKRAARGENVGGNDD